jgi:hypothetical protein
MIRRLLRTTSFLLAAAWLASCQAYGGGIDALATPAGGWKVSLPGEAVREVALQENWSGAQRLSFQVRADPAPRRPLRVLVCLVVWDDWWYQSASLAPVAGAHPRQLQHELGHFSNDWLRRGHMRPWDGYAAQQVKRLRVEVFSPVPDEGVIHLTGPVLDPADESSEEELFVYDCRTVTRRPTAGRPSLMSFRLSRTFANPFDPGGLSVVLRDADGRGKAAPAYFYQGFRRAADGRLEPVGGSSWRAWVTPPAAGEYRWEVRTHDGEDDVRLRAGVLEVKAAGADEPETTPPAPTRDEMMPFTLARRVRSNEPVFALSKGRWALEREKHKDPLVRAWRVPIEWADAWGRFHGLGRYNLETAWEFDQVVEKARAAGIARPLALNTNQPFQGQGKFNWFSNPLAGHMGGPLSAPSEYFTSESAAKFFRQRARYVAARWGRSPAVSRFELWMSMPANHAEAWHRK